jgi:endonuclease G, mitochondrial
MKRIVWMVLVLSGLLVGPEANADYLEVRRDTTLKAQPSSHATVVAQASVGAFLPLLNDGAQVNGYYNVQPSAPGQTAWIYRTLVRRWYGEIPVPVEDEANLSPLRDVSFNLTPEQVGFARRHLRLGKPQAVYERVRQGYVTAQDGRLKIPLWVQYEISPEELNGPIARTDDFQPDTSIPYGYRAELEDYNTSGFDRGHMAPAEDMNRSQRTMAESFLLTNMAPQVGVGFNQQLWKDLETAIRGWVAQRGRLTIITGPIFAIDAGKVSYAVIGADHVAVPTHFYKIVVDANSSGHLDALAFVIPNKNLSGHHYKEYLASIDEIEAATGLDFLSALDPDVQNQLESKKAQNIW